MSEKTEKSKFRKWELALLIALCVSLLVGVRAQARQTKLSESLVRLHVIAVSDDKTEQEIKLRVRDAVLAYLTPKLDNAQDAPSASKLIASGLGGIKAAAESASEGRRVTVSLGEEYYPTRRYGSFSLPAGSYTSLRVVLGEGQGHNWWCVVFPPLCVDAAEADRALEVLDEDDRGLITESGAYEYKFRIVELWGELVEFFNSLPTPAATEVR